MSRATRLAFPLMLLVVSAACGGGGDDGPTATNLETRFDVTAHGDVALLDEDTVNEQLVSSNPMAGEYRFERGADLGDITPGQPVVIPGEGFGLVREVVEDGDQVVLWVEEATLADIIQDGEIAWDYDVSWDDFDITYEQLAAIPGISDIVITRGSGTAGLLNIAYQEPNPRKIEISFEHRGWTFKIEFEPTDGRLNFKLTAGLKVGMSEPAAISGEGWISGFNYSSIGHFSDGAPSDFTTEVNGLQGELELKWAAFTEPGTTIAEVVRFNVPVALPIALPGPFGIPFVLQIKMGGRIVPELSAPSASSGGSWKVTYSSDQGFNVDDAVGKPTGSAKSQKVDTSGDTVSAGEGPVGFGVGLEFPRFELGVAGLEPFAFITLDMYSTSLWTPGTLLTNDIPPCQYGYTKHSAVAGYALKIMGWGGLSDQYTLFEHQENKYLDGKECTLTGD
ncbi:MAG: hypothetical protein GEU80_05530 [Dehalococcoidia bacterium]|nr:hypothetical protein [Dehalococcoidia bacterium]